MRRTHPRLFAGMISILAGMVLFACSAAGIIVYTMPQDADTGTWEGFVGSYDAGMVKEIRVYRGESFFQYRTKDGRTLSVPRKDHSLQSRSGVKYMDNARKGMLTAAAVSCLLLAPITASFATVSTLSRKAAAPIPQMKKPAPQKEIPQTAPKELPKAPPEPPAPPPPEPKEDPLFANIVPKPVAVQETTVTFRDIAGYTETKKNMEFVVKCLQNPDLLRQVGAKIPAGILLYGPPGTGKTLMAKAIAGTAGVRFYSANASEFIRRYVGVGAENVRNLYKEARAHAPSIVFIDEIDAIGGTRGGEGENQEYRQTLNALLTEMDGLSKDSGVMTIAATNDFEHLDPALIRPGRFDRKIAVPLPNYDDRLEIVQLYAEKRNMSEQVSLETIARDTAGMAGAGIHTVFNEAAIHAVMCGRDIILPKDIDSALTQIQMNGVENRSSNEEDRRNSAYHEAGHAVILRLLAGITVPKVSIIGNSSGSAGLTFFTEEEDTQFTAKYLRNRIVAIYGGRAAEELVFGKDQVTAGAKNDLQVASKWIKEYLQGGLGDSLLDSEVFASMRGCEAEEAKNLSRGLYRESMEFLSQHREQLDRVAAALLEKDTLLENELNSLL